MSVGLGVIGLGWWGRTLARSANGTGEARVVAGYARSRDSRQAFASEFECAAPESIDELLESSAVEGILVATNHSSHLALIEAAAAAGKPVFVEKPLTLDLTSGRSAVAATEQAGVALQVGHQRRRMPGNRAIKAMVDAGDLGAIQAAESHQSVPNAMSHAPDAWRRDRDESPLGGMTSLGVHKVDTLHYLVGPMRRVFTMTKNTMAEPEIDEATVVAIEFENGAVGTLVTSFVVAVNSCLSIYGIDGSAHTEMDGNQLYTQAPETGPERIGVSLTQIDPVHDELVEFARVVRGEALPEVGGAEGLAVVSVLDAMVRSAETGMPADVEY
jgi:predicted dehydrogenase